MVSTITLNPAIDKGFEVERLAPDHKLRCPNPSVEAGGGGINVARCIRRLGGDVQAIFLSGGVNGSLLESILRTESIDFRAIQISGETRESIMINERVTGAQYRIVTEGPDIGLEVTNSMIDKILAGVDTSGMVVISGSLPKGMPIDFPAQLAARVNHAGGRCIVDAGGPALLEAVHRGAYLVKPNLRELSELSGVASLELGDVDDAARALIGQGQCQVVVVSLGPAGALWVTRNGSGHIPAPTVKQLSTVGAGDSMVAGIVHALEKGWEISDAVSWGVACGSATTMQPGTQLFDPVDVDRLYNWIRQKKS